MRMLATEKLNEWPIPRISLGKSSAVIVHGIVSNPIMLEQTYINKQKIGTQFKLLAPSEIQIVTAPEMNMNTAIKNDESISKKRRLNFFSK